jgi:hypothetical protein
MSLTISRGTLEDWLAMLNGEEYYEYSGCAYDPDCFIPLDEKSCFSFLWKSKICYAAVRAKGDKRDGTDLGTFWETMQELPSLHSCCLSSLGEGASPSEARIRLVVDRASAGSGRFEEIRKQDWFSKRVVLVVFEEDTFPGWEEIERLLSDHRSMIFDVRDCFCCTPTLNRRIGNLAMMDAMRVIFISDHNIEDFSDYYYWLGWAFEKDKKIIQEAHIAYYYMTNLEASTVQRVFETIRSEADALLIPTKTMTMKRRNSW